jgi:hypothetical protein
LGRRHRPKVGRDADAGKIFLDLGGDQARRDILIDLLRSIGELERESVRVAGRRERRLGTRQILLDTLVDRQGVRQP